MSDETHVKGLRDLHALLQTLPDKVERNIMRGALRVGVKLLMLDAKRRAPIGEPSKRGRQVYGHYRGLLRDSVRLAVAVKRGTVTAKVKAGGKDSQTKGKPTAYYAHMVHQGTKPHVIKPRKAGGALWVGGHWVGSVMHPGTKAQPFMGEAMEARSRAAVVAVRDYIADRLSKQHNLDIPGAGNWSDPE